MTPVALEKDAVIEFPFQGKMNEKQQRQVKMIEELGFSLGRESSMMMRKGEREKRSAVQQQRGEGHELYSQKCSKQRQEIQYAQQEDAEQILQLLCAAFDPLYSFLPSQKELWDKIEKRQVIAIHEGEQVTACLISNFEKNKASIEQVVVSPQQRGRGWGKELLMMYHAKYAVEASSFQHWVDIHNEPAVNMYVQAGYEFQSRKANEYIKRK
ncbi:MAG: GNAT family N-acetyltransferase [Clostridia bacterium]|nr:GNAT family N-acetyltransferase [Clostridia bacterium]